METQQLRYFAAVAEHLGFSAAAKKCHVSQPSLSTQIQHLEEAVGVRLFFRTKRMVRLTPEGQKLLPLVQRILGEMDEVRTYAKALSDPLSGVLRVGVTPMVAQSSLLELLVTLQRGSKQLELQMTEATSRDLIASLREGHRDLILLPFDEQLRASQLKVVAIESSPLLLVLPKGAKILETKTLPFIGVPEGCGLKSAMDEGLRHLRRSGTTVLLAHHTDMIKKWVALGLGWSILPKVSLNPADRKRLKIQELKGNVSIRFCAAMREGSKADLIFKHLGVGATGRTF
jgi:LysR family transcriptional regulator, hydrogen peroxide-inducible genes activator